jgi:hypothetical protein
VRGALAALVVAVALMPVTLVITIVLDPLWRWIEATTGVESIGHSGPAGWCFWLVYALLLADAALVALGLRRSGRAR